MTMDPDIRDALSDIKSSVRDGFADTNRRINDLVTQGEFRATVQRIDAQHENLRRDFDSHVESVPARDQLAVERDQAVAKAAESRDDAIRAEFRADLNGFRATTRWAVGIAATTVGLACTIIFSIINLSAP